jgi:hypothetical protein
LPILHQPLQINFTFPYFKSQSGISKIDALIFFAVSDVKSKKSFDTAKELSAIS